MATSEFLQQCCDYIALRRLGVADNQSREGRSSVSASSLLVLDEFLRLAESRPYGFSVSDLFTSKLALETATASATAAATHSPSRSHEIIDAPAPLSDSLGADVEPPTAPVPVGTDIYIACIENSSGNPDDEATGKVKVGLPGAHGSLIDPAQTQRTFRQGQEIEQSKVLPHSATDLFPDLQRRKFFCSALVAAGLKALGIIPRHYNDGYFWPGSFAQSGELDRVAAGGYLYGEYRVVINIINTMWFYGLESQISDFPVFNYIPHTYTYFALSSLLIMTHIHCRGGAHN